MGHDVTGRIKLLILSVLQKKIENRMNQFYKFNVSQKSDVQDVIWKQ